MIKKFTRVLTVDPGWNTGWAFFQGDLDPIHNEIKLDRSIPNFDKEGRLGNMFYQFGWMVEELQPKTVYIEDTDFRPGSLVSEVSHRRGDIHTLSNLIGCYFAACINKSIECLLLPARIWKGNMDDQAVRARVYSITGRYYPSPHITDAVGIGLSRMGIFNKPKTKMRHKG